MPMDPYLLIHSPSDAAMAQFQLEQNLRRTMTGLICFAMGIIVAVMLFQEAETRFGNVTMGVTALGAVGFYFWRRHALDLRYENAYQRCVNQLSAEGHMSFDAQVDEELDRLRRAARDT